ncbi:MAG: cardiolipin synthase [Desulfofustis sp.]
MRITRKTKTMTGILVVFQILGLISSVHAILQTRTSQGAIAWVVSLNALPIVAVPAYWVLGRSKFNGYVDMHQDISAEIQDEIEQFAKKLDPYKVEAPQTFPEYEAVKKLARYQFLRGNKVELLVDGQATYDSIADGIEKAESYILFQFYILRSDGIGNRFKDQLIRKAEQGLSVYVLYDELGSSGLKADWLADFSAAGIQILPFNTRQGPRNRFQLNFRNHRKIVVVDGKSTWIGGLNVGDDYLGKDPKLSPWRDTHIHILGPAALAAQSSFLADWHWASHEILNGLSWVPQAAPDSSQNVLILASGPADKLETASLFFTNILNLARERIWIATPYFIPDEATMVALRLALLKGLEVLFLTPELNDNWFVRQAANVYLSELKELGAKIYFYDKGFMHQKVMLLDDRLAIVGTVNFDNRSFRLNFEVTGAVADREFAGELERMLLDDLSHSTELIDYNLEEQPLLERFKARGAALMAPVL